MCWKVPSKKGKYYKKLQPKLLLNLRSVLYNSIMFFVFQNVVPFAFDVCPYTLAFGIWS